ncbi:hypothetical protein Cgig2_023780 [Carnegiea gigantea]|uniref:Beta-amylase n=1 Tax=Carnegiea gigantea TaxID=171969 RepID=A0A9Q1JR86_9CARY|nr:hypothetical protein Cgig2_023780 [Carnegiea gigantea]
MLIICCINSGKVCNDTALISNFQADDTRLFVGLPLDVVSEDNEVVNEKAIISGLKALRLLGVEGVELPIWWGIVEKEAVGKYNWSSYLSIVELVQKMGLQVQVSLCFHASQQPKIPLPDWVSLIGESDPNIFFADRIGQRYKDCLSLSVDDLPVLEGKSPMEVYKGFFESFKSSFASFMGSTITDVVIGLGPDGELRYPSCHLAANPEDPIGVGEFQCYDKYMLEQLKQYGESNGNPLWGLGGPHDVPTYDQPPSVDTFFKDQGGSWETPYGVFFLSWYSSQLISHGDRILSLAASVLRDSSVNIAGKLPLVHTWFKTRSHPSELTAGFYNTATSDGYDEVVKMFAKNACRIVLPGMDLLDDYQRDRASPQRLIAQIKETCGKHRVHVSGQNTLVSETSDGFEEMRKNLSKENEVVDSFTYQRMGTNFFAPEHFRFFIAFVQKINQLDANAYDKAEDMGRVEAMHLGMKMG